jgi:diadenosine tetraphosphate (Ap4A) HIT family hydrolase
MPTCAFCKIIAGELPSTRIYEDDTVIAFMDIHPLRPGHVLIIPREHVQQLHQLTPTTQAHLINTGSRIAHALYQSSLKPAAVHYVVNDGPAAQQTVPHVHLHVMPRYQGDSGKFVARLLRKPLDILLGPTAREKLEAEAIEIRQHLN